ncbi:uncharacterized protein [Coffea arabica]|uniref:Endonuclease/exonuclease/phosphatase domain-containing protein n=1 Tax=Coffea arabica TaxID=13443 RepID=A0ABM4VMN7_COFAR
MKVGVWNCRGAGSSLTVPQLKEVIHLHSPGVLFLSETKNQKKFMKNVKKRLNFDDSAVVDSVGKAGGLALFWKHWIKMIEVEVSSFYITARMMDMEARCEWAFIGVYASTDDKQRRSQWRELEGKMNQWGERWIIAGDFNDILTNWEKWGGRQRPEWSFTDFKGLVNGNDLVDIGYEGKP